MRGSLIIVAFFIAGLLLARWGWIPSSLSEGDVSIWALYALMFLVGISIGSDTQALKAIRGQHWKILWVPVATWAGTLAGTALASLLLPSRSLADCLAVGSGFGYYSLSSVIISGMKEASLGSDGAAALAALALMTNMTREILSIAGAPLLVRLCGRTAPVVAAGVTSMDSALPAISRSAGADIVPVALVHGMVLEVATPVLVTFFCSL